MEIICMSGMAQELGMAACEGRQDNKIVGLRIFATKNTEICIVWFELEDQKWFPNVLREQQTAYIGWMVRNFGIYKGLDSIIAGEVSKHAGTISDLGSGTGGPWKQLAQSPLLRGASIELTDLYPQSQLDLPPNCSYYSKPLPALQSLPHAKGLVTMFNAFHHFNVEEREQLIRNFTLNGRSFLAAEILGPTVPDFLRILVATTLGQLLFAPFIKPFSAQRLLFTYILPINLITVTWDGLASVFRGISGKEMEAMAAKARQLGASAKVLRLGTWYAPVRVLLVSPP